MSLISRSQAQRILTQAEFPEWAALTPSMQSWHLSVASAYIRLNYQAGPELLAERPDFTWDEFITWPLPTAELVARYADSDRAGILYPQANTDTRPLERRTVKLGSMELTNQYADTRKALVAPNNRALEDQMRALGFEFMGAPGKLRRV